MLLESLPLKQGLKPVDADAAKAPEILLESLPLKQGLKHTNRGQKKS